MENLVSDVKPGDKNEYPYGIVSGFPFGIWYSAGTYNL